MKILKVLGKQGTLFLELSSIINITTKLIPSGQHLRPYHIFMILFYLKILSSSLVFDQKSTFEISWTRHFKNC